MPDGAHEGAERGIPAGTQAGQSDGRAAGFSDCQAQAQSQAQQQGYNAGIPVGQSQGTNAGQTDGQRDGTADGRSEGAADGRRRATADSRAAAQAPATQDGNSQVDVPGVQQQANADAVVKADADARATANASDYQRGHADRHAELISGPIVNNDSFSQLEVTSPSVEPMFLSMLELSDKSRLSVESSVPSPSFRYSNPRRTYGYDSENSAYRTGYRSGYTDGFGRAYSESYDSSYRPAYANGQQSGCSDAQSRDYSSSYQSGYESGRSDAYHQAYDAAHSSASDAAYQAVFGGASQAAYQATYASEYQRQYAAIRSAAYQSRHDAVYKAAYDTAYRQKYDQVYPAYRDQAYQRGRQDENRDFAGNPLKFVDAALVDINDDGIIAPGDLLRVKLNLRNYADHAVVPQDLEISISSISGATASVTKLTPIRGLNGQSLTAIRDLFEIRPTQQAVGSSLTVQIQVKYRGQLLDTKRLTAQVKFPLRFAGVDLPSGVREGFEAVGTFALTNLSSKALPAGSKVKLSLNADSDLADLLDREITLPEIPATGTIKASFRFIPRRADGNLSLLLVLNVQSLDGTVVLSGMVGSDAAPIASDYHIELKTDLGGLERPGLIRVQYELANLVGQNGTYRSAQIRVSVLSPDGVSANPYVRVIGPNPQTLTTMDGKPTVDFMIPLAVSAANSGGYLVVEVLDDGKVVRSHRAEF